MSTDKDETYTIIVKGKMLSSIKADLIHAFLSVNFAFYKTIYFSSSFWGILRDKNNFKDF